MITFNLYAIPPMISFALIAGMGAFVYLRDPRSRLYRTFALSCLTLAWWLFGFINMYLSWDPARALAWSRLALYGVVFIPATMYHFILTLLNLKHPRRLTFLYIAGLATLPLGQTPLVYKAIRTGFWGFYPVAGPFYFLCPLTFVLAFVGTVLLVYRAWHKEHDIQRRRQLTYVLFAQACATPGIVDYLAKYGVPVYPFGYLDALGWIGWLMYAIVRHHLMDIRVIITRTGVLMVTYLIVLGGPFLLGWWGQPWLQVHLGSQWWLGPVGLSSILATMGPFTYAYLRRQSEQLLLHRLEEKEAEATYDALTGLLVRRALMSRAAAMLQRARVHHTPCSVLMLDLDHFKHANDTYGHLVGDAVLREVAARLTASLRTHDLAGRFGGEEFVFVLEGTARQQAVQIAERLCQLVARDPVQVNGHLLSQTISIGIATHPENGATFEALLAQADQALYAAKRAGRNRVRIAASTASTPESSHAAH